MNRVVSWCAVRTRQFFAEVLRVRWPLVFALTVVTLRQYGLLSPQSLWSLVAYKLALACMAFVAAHIAYSQVFHYLDMRGLLFRSLSLFEFEGQSEHAQFVTAMTFVGACFLRGVIYAAFIIGVLVGL